MRGPFLLFRRAYGAGPLNLIASLAALALAGYGLSAFFQTNTVESILIWFLGSIVVHDLLFFPLYALLDRIAGGVGKRRGEASPTGAVTSPAEAVKEPSPAGTINYVRVPVVLSGISLLAFFPLILALNSPRYDRASGLSPDVYLERWLLLVAALFLASGILFAIRWRVRRRREARPGGRAETATSPVDTRS